MNDKEVGEISNIELKRRIVRMVDVIKDSRYNHLNEFKENANEFNKGTRT
jgi:hypothetical protein